MNSSYDYIILTKQIEIKSAEGNIKGNFNPSPLPLWESGKFMDGDCLPFYCKLPGLTKNQLFVLEPLADGTYSPPYRVIPEPE